MAPRDVIRKLRSVVKELFKRTEVQDLINNVATVESCMTFLIDEDSLIQYADMLKALKKDAASSFRLFARIRGKSKVAEEVKRVFEEEFVNAFPGYDEVTGNPNIHITSKPQAIEPPSKKRARSEEEEANSASKSGKRSDGEKTEKETLKVIIRLLMKQPNAAVFLHPVSAEVFPDYYQLIKQPRDLTSTLENAPKAPVEETLGDVRLVWDNCKTYNAEGSDIYDAANELSNYFEEQVASKLGGEYSRSSSLTITLPTSRARGKEGKEGKVVVKEELLMDPKDAKRAMQRILGEIKKSAWVDPFLEPVDVAEAPGYTDVVRTPMDISTVEKAVRDGRYGGDLGAFRADMDLIWDNCSSYNDEGSDISNFAQRLRAQFYDLYDKLPPPVSEVKAVDAKAAGKEHRPRMRSILDVLQRSELSEPFRYPVNLAEAPGYAEAIATPMDLSTVAARIDGYASLQDFAADVRLIFRNCEEYNDDESALAAMSKECHKLFEEELEKATADPPQPKAKVEKTEKAASEPSRRRSKETKQAEPKQADSEQAEPEKTVKAPRRRGGAVVEEIWSTEDDGSTGFRVSKLTEENLDDLLIQLQAPEALTSYFIRSRAHKRAHEAGSKLINYATPLYPLALKEGIQVFDLGKLPTSSHARPLKMPTPTNSSRPSVLPAFSERTQLLPLGYACEKQLRLAICDNESAVDKAPHIDITFRSRIVCENEQDRRKPLFEVSCENTVVVTADSPRAAWEQAVLAMDGRILKVVGGKLKRCRAVLNRLCASQHIVPFLEQVEVDSAEGRDYYRVVRAPMWLREIHRRLVAGTYDWEFDFAWDVRLVFQNCMSYNLPGSDLYVTAEQLLCFFEELLCQWVLNVQDASIDDLARGDWDEWAYLKYFDEPAGLDDHFCVLSKQRLPEQELIMCTACDDQYEIAAINIQRITKELAKSWTCQRCIKARDFSFLCLDPPSQSIMQYSPYCKLNFGEQIYLPAPHIGPGWFQARLRDTVGLDDTFISPLGVLFSGADVVEEQMVHEALLNKELHKDREVEFFGKGGPTPSKKRRSSSKRKVHSAQQQVEPADAAAEDGHKLSFGALCGYDLAPGAQVRLLLPVGSTHEPLLPGDGNTFPHLPPTGFFSLSDTTLTQLLEGLENAALCEGYVFANAVDEQKRAVAECKAEKTRRRTRGALEVRSVKRVSRERWQWEICKTEHAYFHVPPEAPRGEGGDDGMDVEPAAVVEEEREERGGPAVIEEEEGAMDLESPSDDGLLLMEEPYDYTKQLQPLLPPGTTSAEGEALLALWDMLFTCNSSIGELSFTLADLIRCLDPPPSSAQTSLGQVIFDEVCTSLSHMLLLDLKKSCVSRYESHTDTIWEAVLMTKPINIVTWPHVLLATLHARHKGLSESTVVSTLLHGPSAHDIARRNLLVALFRHPDVCEACSHSRPFKDRMGTVRDRAYFNGESGSESVGVEGVEGVEESVPVQPYESVAEMVLEIQEALQELAQRGAPSQLDNALNALQWLGDECRRTGVEGVDIHSHGGRLSQEPLENLASGADRARALELFLDDGYSLPSYINPFDFGNRTAITLAGMEAGDARKELERRGVMAEVDCISRALHLLATADPDSWPRAQRLDVLSALTVLCSTTELVKAYTSQGDKRTSKTKRFADISDVPLGPAQQPDLEHVVKGSMREGAKCHFTGATLSPSELCVYVPADLLTGAWYEGASSTRGSKERPVASEAVVLRVLAATQFAQKSEEALQKQYEQALVEVFSQNSSRSARPVYERAMPIGYDRHGSQFWLLDAQLQMTIADLHEAAQSDEQSCLASPEPYLLVKKCNGHWYKLACSVATFPKFLQQLHDDIPCERVLQRCAAERVWYTRCTLHRGMLSARSVQVDWLQRIRILFEWVAKWTPNTSAEPREQMKQLEIYAARLCELRSFVHIYLLFEERDEKERLKEVKSDANKEREQQRKRIAKLRGLWADEFFDAHHSKGYLRGDHLAKIRYLTCTTSATFIHYNFEYFKLYSDNMTKCQVPFSYLQELHDAREGEGREMDVDEAEEEGGGSAAVAAEESNEVKAETAAENPEPSEEPVKKENPEPEEPTATKANPEPEETPAVQKESPEEPVKTKEEADEDEPEEEPEEGEEGQGRPGQDASSSNPSRPGLVFYKKMVEQIHPETGEVLRVYPSGKFAALFMQISQGGISQCCNGNCQEFCGFKWRFYTGPPIDFSQLEGKLKTYEEIAAAVGQSSRKYVYDATRKPPPMSHLALSPRPATVPTFASSFGGGGAQPENPSEPRKHVVLALEMMSIRLVKLKAEMLNILYVAPIRRVRYVNIPPDDPAEIAAAAFDKARRKEMRHSRRARGQELFIDELRRASSPAELMQLVKLLERMLGPFSIFHNTAAMPCEDAVTCAEVATNVFALDRALRYDSNDFEHKSCRPAIAASLKTHKPRTAFVPRCVYSFTCTSHFGHNGKCSTFGSPIPSRIMEFTDPLVRPPNPPPVTNYVPYNNPTPYRRPEERVGKIVEEIDIENITPLAPPRDISQRMEV